jgi:hypothetical protein
MSAWKSTSPDAALRDHEGRRLVRDLRPEARQVQVELWHETLGKGKGEVTIKDDGSSEPLALTMKPKEKK